MKWITTFFFVSLVSFSVAQKGSPDTNQELLKSSTVSGLKFRNIGPALTSGRIIDLAVNPVNQTEWYVAVASGGVWKTQNAGITFQPVFDKQPVYSIGCITLDPQNPHTVWVGSGENNGQRSVGYGDGVYKSLDGGQTWKNMGLENAEHIGKIIVHPQDPNTVYVAAQGPLWSPGGERGLYRTRDGGLTWEHILEISEHTGVSDLAMDPRDPNILYATSWQRRRHVHSWISGGPESALYKSTDGGDTWRKLTQGLPSGDIGRIGLAISPAEPDYVFAMIEGEGKKGGFFRSINRGESWEKQSNYQTIGLYYQEIFCDPIDVDRIYAMDTYAHVSDDGGKTFTRLGEDHKHVDNHAMWINPKNPSHYLMGCDGGLYQSFDRGKNWSFFPNLPITQFYKVATDNSEPFYYVYGGTQDNFSLGGPSQTISSSGITNADWFVTKGGDGFETQIDPENPNIIYAQSQYGNLARFDKLSGEKLNIKPLEGKDEEAYRWNWDAPLLISPHKSSRLYFAANKLFRSEDRGNSWKTISEDLTRQRNRDQIRIMDKVWSIDAVARNKSTSIYGNITALDESPLQEDLIYVGTDDGLIQITDNGGKTWNKVDQLPGIPEYTYVNMILASRHDAQIVYAVFNNHKNGDFKPYILKSTDQGKSWSSISNTLPEKGSVYCIAQDHTDPELLFAGTEFGVFFSRNGGAQWIQLKGNLPTIAIRDMEIQKRENDLVLASFGRGFYILDDFTPLRMLADSILEQDAHIFAVEDAQIYMPSSPLGGSGKAFQGASFYTADNPPLGATFTYYLKSPVPTLNIKRLKAEKEAEEKNQDISFPSPEEIRAEDREPKPFLLFTITDQQGDIVRKIRQEPVKGINRISWDLRYPSSTPTQAGKYPSGHIVSPGTYDVAMSIVTAGEITLLTPRVPFEVKSMDNLSLPVKNMEDIVTFQAEAESLYRSVTGAVKLVDETENKLKLLQTAILQSNEARLTLLDTLNQISYQLDSIKITLQGDYSLASRGIPTPPSILQRINYVVGGLRNVRSEPTRTQRDNLDIVRELFNPLLDKLTSMIEKDIQKLETQLDKAGAPWTPGRIPSDLKK